LKKLQVFKKIRDVMWRQFGRQIFPKRCFEKLPTAQPVSNLSQNAQSMSRLDRSQSLPEVKKILAASE